MKKAFLLDLLTILVGCSLMAAGLDIFVIPNSISPGGVSGLSAALVQLLPLSVGTLSLLINIPLLIAAWKVLGLPRVIRHAGRNHSAQPVSRRISPVFTSLLR